MGNVSLGVFGIILGLVFLASMWTIISNIRRRMHYEMKGDTKTSVSCTFREEGRRQGRSGIAWPVTIETPAGSVGAETKDLSLGGAFIICRSPLPLKEQFQMTIEVPGQRAMSLTSEVVWSNGNVPEEKVIHRGMGIRFIKTNEEEHQLLKRALSAASLDIDTPRAPAEPEPALRPA